MKIRFLTLAAVATMMMVVMAACNHKKSHDDDEDDDEDIELTDDEDEDDEDEDDAFRMKTVKFDKSDDHATVSFEFDYPLGNSVVADSIRAFILRIDSSTGNDEDISYTGPVKNGAEFIKYFGKKVFESLSEQHAADLEDVNKDREEGEDPIYFGAYSQAKEYKLEYDAPHYVTYVVDGDDYLGGAHGLPYCYGATFSKADGHMLGNPVKDTDSPAFHKLLIEGVASYFSEDGVTEDNLHEWLLVEPDNLTGPANEPFLVKNGVRFIYSAYEIAPFAAGLPEFTIPYDKIKPFLTTEAKRLIED